MNAETQLLGFQVLGLSTHQATNQIQKGIHPADFAYYLRQIRENGDKVRAMRVSEAYHWFNSFMPEEHITPVAQALATYKPSTFN